MGLTSFLTFNHYVAYDGEHDMELAVIAKCVIVKYKAKCDDKDREKIFRFSYDKRVSFHEAFLKQVKQDIKWAWRQYFSIYELSMTDEQLVRSHGTDAEDLYKLYMELEQAYYDKLYGKCNGK